MILDLNICLRARDTQDKYRQLHLPLIRASALLLAVCTGCASKAEKPAPPPPAVTIAPVVQMDVPIRQEWVGTMVGNIDADIRPKVEGYLLTRIYTEGSFVQKGQMDIERGTARRANAVPLVIHALKCNVGVAEREPLRSSP